MRHTNRSRAPPNWWSSPSPLGSSSGDRMERRYFLGTVLMTSAFAHLGTIRTVEAGDRAPREFSAVGRTVDWINSPPLTPEHLAGKVVLVNVWTLNEITPKTACRLIDGLSIRFVAPV